MSTVRAAVRCAVERGISVFDTADVYGLGRGEEELSAALGMDRHRVTIITKGGVRWGIAGRGKRASTGRDASRPYLARAVEDSLRRLRIEAIPVYLVHWPDPTTPLDETLEFLDEARCEGKILSYGLSNHSKEAVFRARRDWGLSAAESPLSLLSPSAAVSELVELRQMGVFTLVYGPLAQGLLAGRYGPESRFPVTDRRHRLSHFSPDALARYRPVMDTLATVSRESGRSQAQVALRWVLECQAASFVVVGARSPRQVCDNLDAFMGVFDHSHRSALRDARMASRLCEHGAEREGSVPRPS